MNSLLSAPPTQQSSVRQSRSMAAEWGGKGADTHVEVLDGLDHFTMLDPLADKDSSMVRRLVTLATAE